MDGSAGRHEQRTSIKILRLNSEKANLAHRIEMLLYPIFFFAVAAAVVAVFRVLDDVGGQGETPVVLEHGVSQRQRII